MIQIEVTLSNGSVYGLDVTENTLETMISLMRDMRMDSSIVRLRVFNNAGEEVESFCRRARIAKCG